MAKQTSDKNIQDSQITDWLHIFTCGTIPQLKIIDGEPQIVEVEIKPEYIQELANNYDRDWQEASFMIGHRDYEQPALAWIYDLKAEGMKLFGRLYDITPRLQEIIANKEYKYVSIGTDIYTRDGKDIRYLGHLAATNFPLILGLQKLPEAFTGIAASRRIDNIVTQKIDFENFSKGLKHSSAIPENLKNNSMNEKLKLLAAKIGISVSEYPTEDEVLVRASEIVQELLSKFPEGSEQPSSLYMSIVSCGNLVTECSALKTKVTDLNGKLEASNAKLRETIIASALETGKILESEKETYEGLLADSFERTSNLLASKKPSGIFAANQIKNPINVGEKIEASANETYESLMKNDPEKLAGIKATNPELFKSLYRNYYKEEFVD